MPVTDTTGEYRHTYEPWPKWLDYLAAILLTIIFTLLLKITEPYIPIARYPVYYIFAVMAVAYFFGPGPALVAFVTSFLAFTYFFVEPVMTIWPLATTPLGWAALATLCVGALIGGAAALALRKYRRRAVELADRLRQSERQHRLLFENMNEMVAVEELVYDENGRPIGWIYKDVNPEYEKISNTSRDEIVGRRATEVYEGSSQFEQMLSVYSRVISTGQPERFERYFSPLGKYILISAFPLGGDRFATVITDITDIRRAEETLQRYQLLSRNARDILLFIASDGRITEANKAAEDIYGYSREELLSLTIYDLRDPGTLYPAADQMMEASDRGMLFETTHRRKDGSTFPVEVSAQGATIGNERALLSIVRDITERRRAEQQLDLERRRLQAVLDALPVGVFIAGADGCITQTNETVDQIWGGKAPSVCSIDEYEVYKGWWADSGKRINPHEWALARALTTGEISTGEVINIERFDGARGTILNSVAPIRDMEGKITGAVAAVEDITELVRLRQELERSLEEEREESHRVAALESVAEAGIKTLELQDLLDTLAERIRTTLDTHSCTIMMLDEDSNELVIRAVIGEPPEPGVRIKATAGFTGKINNERRTIYVADAQEDPLVIHSHLKRSGVRSLLGTPLITRGKIVGVAYVDMMDVHRFEPEDIRLFEAMATRAASAIENARLHEQLVRSQEKLQYNLSLLQRALAPSAPSMEGNYEVAAVYIPALAAGQEIGGDFYDVFKTRDGRYAILMGDVSGKGIPAASMAAITRSTIHAFAYESSCASVSLTRTNAVLCSQSQDFGPFVTAFLAVLHLESGELCYASAGHPPAMLCCTEGTAHFLESGQPPIGLICGHEYTENRCRLDPGDKMIAYTDGITEARHGTELFELEGVARTIEEHRHLPASELVENLLKAASDWADGHLGDDAAIVVIEHR